MPSPHLLDVKVILAWSRDGDAIHGFLHAVFSLPLPKPDRHVVRASGFPSGGGLLAIAVCLAMAGVTSRDERFRSMGPWSFGVMDVEVRGRATSHTWEMIAHLGPQFPFCHVEGFVAVRIGARNPDPERIDMLIRSCFPPRIFHVGAGVLPEVRMQKSRPSLLRIAAPGEFLPCGEPLIRRQ